MKYYVLFLNEEIISIIALNYLQDILRKKQDKATMYIVYNHLCRTGKKHACVCIKYFWKDAQTIH